MSSLASPSQAPARISLPTPLESMLAEHGIYQMHFRLLLSDPQVMRAYQKFDQIRRNVHAGMNKDVMTMLAQINGAQHALVQVMRNALSDYPALQKKLQDLTVQLALLDGLAACAA